MDAKEKNLNTVVSSVWPSIQLKRSFCTQACRARKALLKFLQNTNVGVILLLKICHHFNHPPSPIFCLSSLSCIFLYPHPFLQIILLGTSPRSPHLSAFLSFHSLSPFDVSCVVSSECLSAWTFVLPWCSFPWICEIVLPPPTRKSCSWVEADWLPSNVHLVFQAFPI